MDKRSHFPLHFSLKILYIIKRAQAISKDGLGASTSKYVFNTETIASCREILNSLLTNESVQNIAYKLNSPSNNLNCFVKDI